MSIEISIMHATVGIQPIPILLNAQSIRLKWITFVNTREGFYAPGLSYGGGVVSLLRNTTDNKSNLHRMKNPPKGLAQQ